MKQLTLGKKIALGFAALLAICLALGTLAVVQMGAVSDRAHKLAEQYVPETAISSALGRATADTVLAIRSYGLTSDPKFYEQAQKKMVEVKENIEKARALVAKHPGMVKLKEEMDAFEKDYAEFSALVAETKTRSEAIDKVQTEMNAGAGQFVTRIEVFQNAQDQALRADIKASLAADKLEERAKKIELATEARNLMNQVRIAAWKAQAERDFKPLQDAQAKFGDIEKVFAQIRPITHREEDKQSLVELAAAAKTYEASTHALVAAQTALAETGAKRLKIADHLAGVANEIVEVGVDRTTKEAAGASATLDSASVVLLVGLGVASVVGILLAWLITRGITRAVWTIVEKLNAGAEQTAAASSQVAGASQALAEGSSEQAASLEETGASLEEMTSMIKRNAEAANKAKTLAGETRAAADTGATDMREMQTAMGDIKASSDSVSKILKDIDEIAFQTNILALNAAVEAARAGEAGMGFAVVADEVRNLAQRSAKAAKDTAAKIEDAISKSQRGVEISGKVAKNFDDIAGKTREVDRYVAEIASASSEQSQGIGQIGMAVTQMDKTTQSNAANAEENASASEELSAQAEALQESVRSLQRLVGVDTEAREEATPRSTPVARSAPQNPTTPARLIKPKRHTMPQNTTLAGHGNGRVNGNGNGNGNGHGGLNDLPMPEEAEFRNF